MSPNYTRMPKLSFHSATTFEKKISRKKEDKTKGNRWLQRRVHVEHWITISRIFYCFARTENKKRKWRPTTWNPRPTTSYSRPTTISQTLENLNILKISLIMEILLLLLTTSKSLVITSNGIIVRFLLPEKQINIVQ